MTIIDEVFIEVNKRRKRAYQNEIRLYRNITSGHIGTEEKNFIDNKIKECERLVEEYDGEIKKIKRGI